MIFRVKYPILFLPIIILFAFSFIFLSTGSDESILAEQAWWFSELGYVKSKLFAGMGQGWEIQQLHYHKLFIWTGALFIELFGFSIYALKVIPLLFLGAFIFIYRKFFIYEQLDKNFLLALFLLLINTHIFIFSTIYRPEVILMTFGFLSYFILKVAMDRNDLRFFILAGVVAGICPLWHLNGLMFLGAGGILLLYKKEFKGLILFGFFGTIIFLIYFLDILLLDKLNAFFDQLFNDPNIKDDATSSIYPFNKIFLEHKRIFRSFKEATISIIPVLALIFNFKYLIRKHSGLLIYTVSLVLFLALIAHGIRPLYSQIYYPFFILILIYSFHNPKLKSLYKKLIPFVLVIYAVVQLFYILMHIPWGHNILKRNEDIEQYLEVESKVLTTETFVFNNLPDYDITGLLGYRYGWLYRDINVNTLPEDDLFSFARKFDRDYIIVDAFYDDEEMLTAAGYNELEVGEILGGYQVIVKQDDYIIFKLN